MKFKDAAMNIHLRSVLIATCAIGMGAGLSSSAISASAPKRTIGLVVTSWFSAKYNTPHWEECPEGAALGNDELWIKNLPQAQRIKATAGGAVQPVDGERKTQAVVRGPKGEDVCWNPEVVKDPPMRIVRGKTGYGFNLDGTDDGRATPKSCKHDKFTSPEGVKVDNQLYRLLGCILGMRNDAYLEGHPNQERQDSGKGTILIEISDVDDAKNDDAVQVAFYGSIDTLPKDSTGKILANASYRINDNPIYGTKARGKIVDGVLATDAADVRLPMYGNNYTGDIPLKDMRLNLTLPREGKPANGLMGGYYDFAKWWDYFQKIEFLLVSNQWSCPQVYVAAKELRDGYPDPQTGECTALSTAMTIEALPAFVIHPDKPNRVAANDSPTRLAAK